jgi:hypothetical protein
MGRQRSFHTGIKPSASTRPSIIVSIGSVISFTYSFNLSSQFQVIQSISLFGPATKPSRLTCICNFSFLITILFDNTNVLLRYKNLLRCKKDFLGVVYDFVLPYFYFCKPVNPSYHETCNYPDHQRGCFGQYC